MIRERSECFRRRHKLACVVDEDRNERQGSFLLKCTVEKTGSGMLMEKVYLTYRPLVTVCVSVLPSVFPAITRPEFSGERAMVH